MREDEIRAFYERGYSQTADQEWFARWRQLGAVGKAEHIVKLAGGLAPRSILEVGCGDGAVLAELGRRGIGERRVGIEIVEQAVELAAARPEIADARVYDGRHIPARDGEYDLAVATHVLEHVPRPSELLREMTRVARAVVIEVPLEHNLSAHRPAAVALSQAAGHLHRFARRDIRRLIVDVGWRVRAELLDPLPLAIHTFHGARARGYAKWLIRSAVATVPPLGERLITLHYALLASPAAGAS